MMEAKVMATLVVILSSEVPPSTSSLWLDGGTYQSLLKAACSQKRNESVSYTYDTCIIFFVGVKVRDARSQLTLAVHDSLAEPKCILIDEKHRHRSIDRLSLQSKMIRQCNLLLYQIVLDSVQVNGRESNTKHDVIKMILTLTNSQEDYQLNIFKHLRFQIPKM